MYVYIPCVYLALVEAEEGVGTHTDCSEPPCVFWGTEPGSPARVVSILNC